MLFCVARVFCNFWRLTQYAIIMLMITKRQFQKAVRTTNGYKKKALRKILCYSVRIFACLVIFSQLFYNVFRLFRFSLYHQFSKNFCNYFCTITNNFSSVSQTRPAAGALPPGPANLLASTATKLSNFVGHKKSILISKDLVYLVPPLFVIMPLYFSCSGDGTELQFDKLLISKQFAKRAVFFAILDNLVH